MQEAVKSDAVSRIQVLQAQSNVATSQAAVSNAEAALNLSLIHIYTVTAENKAWQRVYSIGVREQSVSDIPNEFHFEDRKSVV